MNTKKEYSLAEIFSVIVKHLWIILMCIALGTAGGFLLSKYVIEEEYTASVSMYVAPNQGNADVVTSISDLDYAQQVANTYIEILRTNIFMRDVANKSGLKYTSKELSKMIKIKVVENTEIFQIEVVSNDPVDSLTIAETVSSLAPKKIIEIVDANAVKVVDPAVLLTKPTAPNVMINTAIGFILGAMLSIMFFLISDMMDKRIKNENDIKKYYDVHVLGTVPRFEK